METLAAALLLRHILRYEQDPAIDSYAYKPRQKHRNKIMIYYQHSILAADMRTRTARPPARPLSR